MRSSWLLSGWVLLATACGTNNEAAHPALPARKPLYFDVKGFLDAQTQLLSRRSPAVRKQVQLRNGQRETVRVPHVDWNKELQIFYQADINKAALRGAYTVEPTTTTADGLRQQTYQRKPGIENAVERLTVLSDEQGVRQVAATLRQDNPLFFSQKKLIMSTSQGTLNNYRVDGVQKLIMFDTLRYSAAVRIQ